jgi:hypothetical protein
MVTDKIIISKRDFAVKQGQAVNLLVNTFYARYLSIDEKANIIIDRERLQKDTLKVARALVLNDENCYVVANKLWKDENKVKDTIIEIIENG